MSSWLTVHAADPDTQRRGRNLIILALAMAALALVFIPVSLGQGLSTGITLLLLGAAPVFLAAAALGRVGRVDLGAWVIILITVVATLGSLGVNSASLGATYFLVLAVLLSGVLLPPVQVWSVMVVCLIGLPLGLSLVPAETLANPAWRGVGMNSGLLLVMVALITYLGSSGVRAALAAVQAARAEAEQANARLAASNADLERRIEERTSALRQAADEQRGIAAELQASLESQRELNRIVAELSVPIIPVSADTLVVPLVGNLDSARAERLLTSLLRHVEQSGARTVVLDVTGVPLVDTQVAAALLRVAGAARLMGAEAVLAGIRPEVAQALVHLGVDLVSLRTAATLQDSLTHTLQRSAR